jgi:two-component system, NarL family, sensor kinase
MLALGPGFMSQIDSGLYDVINYRLGHQLPLAPAVLVFCHVSEPGLALIPLIILLFPEGRLPSPRWGPIVVGYLALTLIDMIVQGQMSVYALTHHRTEVDGSGQLLLSNGVYSAFFAPVGLIFFASWIVSVGYQLVRWQRASGEQRQQLSWLMAGGAAALIAFLAAVAANALPHSVRGAVSDVLVCGVAALPVGMGVAILRYRLYEIDRIVSRTLAHAIMTGLLLGVYAGLVLLARQVLSVSSPVAVAASTLAAAALFTRCGGGCSGWWTAGLTGSGTTGSGWWRRSRPG